MNQRAHGRAGVPLIAPTRYVPLDLARDADEVMGVRSRALGSYAATYPQARETILQHARRSGVRGFRAEVGPAIVGFAYGAPTSKTWKWTQRIASSMPPRERESWLSTSFAVSELYVLPDYQGRGVGRRLVTMLCASAAEARALLTTPATALAARSLYRSLGFIDIAALIDSTPFELRIMGATLPLRHRPAAELAEPCCRAR